MKLAIRDLETVELWLTSENNGTVILKSSKNGVERNEIYFYESGNMYLSSSGNFTLTNSTNKIED